jgi:general stress protein YciG
MVWFKVDDSFHSHPKAMAVSLAALGLWTAAGSWSGAHLTDGFIPDRGVQLLARGESALAEELVAAGLWKRTKGGYRFHQWVEDSDGTERNPTAKQVKEKRSKRAEAGRKGGVASGKSRSKTASNNEANASARASPIVEPPSRPVPSFSGVPVSRGGHPGNARENRPPEHCSKHINDPTDDPCRACRRARETAKAFDVDQTRANSEARSVDARQRAADRAREIAACDLCGDDGYRNGQPCDHDPESEARAARGRQAVSAVLSRNRDAS